MRIPGRAAPAVLAVAVLVAAPRGADAFALFPDFGGATQTQLSQAARWSSSSGLDDGLQVGIAPGVAAALQVAGDALVDIEQAIMDGFLAWQSPALQFDITLDALGTVEGADSGFEIDVFAVPDSHPLFVANPQAFTGLAVPSVSFFADRPLTNGTTSAGYAITGADIFFNIDNWQLLGPLGALRLDILTRVTMHELGHALGFGHPNESTNFDTDGDPSNAMGIDPNDPYANLSASLNFDATTIMSNEPCGPNPVEFCAAAAFTTLGVDEIGGRDALYPVVPEPAAAWLVAVGLVGLAAARRPTTSGRSVRSSAARGAP